MDFRELKKDIIIDQKKLFSHPARLKQTQEKL